MERNTPFYDVGKSKPKLTSLNATPTDLKRYLILVFGSYAKAAQLAQFGTSRLHQIFMGVSVPQTPDLIKRIATAWNVDLVVLTSLFNQLERGENE